MRPQQENRRHLLITILFACLCVCSCAQKKSFEFIQITDTHLYDDALLSGGRIEREVNKAALADSVLEINRMIDGGREFKFAVITGDIGLEKLIGEDVKKLPATKDERESGRLGREINNKLTGAAMEVASILAPSKVDTWLLLPGNNDLVDEDPHTINYYRDFVEALSRELKGKRVIDLCPRAKDAGSGVYELDSYAFVGFNNASFKNNDSPTRITQKDDLSLRVSSNAPLLPTQPSTPLAKSPSPAAMPDITAEQQTYVRQVFDRVNAARQANVYIFFHIPETDDYHLVRDFDLAAVNRRGLSAVDEYAFSAWFVDGVVRRDWAQVVELKKVRGLFAGHYHDWRRDTYKGFGWMRTSGSLYKGVSKLHVCPPLAAKRQDGEPLQARGFMTVALDAAGTVTAERLWYDGTAHTFSAADEPAEAGSEDADMKIFEELVKLVGHLAWPLFALTIVILLKGPISGILKSLGRRVADPDSEVTLGDWVTVKKHVAANSGNLEALEESQSVLRASLLKLLKGEAQKDSTAPASAEREAAAAKKSEEDRDHLKALADEYLRIQAADRSEKVRRKNEYATMLGDFVITHEVSKDWLAGQTNNEGLILALVSAVNAMPEEGDFERLMRVSGHVQRLHVRYKMALTLGYLFERRLAAAANAKEACEVLDAYENGADEYLKERIARTRSIIDLIANPPAKAS